ncbi:MAG: hypothetical protein CMK03_07460 [Ponticaulis sp.]|nr:hypothetical protein [Ponticaulis sp.]
MPGPVDHDELNRSIFQMRGERKAELAQIAARPMDHQNGLPLSATHDVQLLAFKRDELSGGRITGFNARRVHGRSDTG